MTQRWTVCTPSAWIYTLQYKHSTLPPLQPNLNLWLDVQTGSSTRPLYTSTWSDNYQQTQKRKIKVGRGHLSLLCQICCLLLFSRYFKHTALAYFYLEGTAKLSRDHLGQTTSSQPAVIMLQRLSIKVTNEDHGNKTMKANLAAAVKGHLTKGHCNCTQAQLIWNSNMF